MKKLTPGGSVSGICNRITFGCYVTEVFIEIHNCTKSENSNKAGKTPLNMLLR